MKVLVDTAVWVQHFKERNEQLADLLEAGAVICHPYIVTEIACGTPPNRRALIGMLQELESAAIVTQAEVLGFIERKALHGRGCGFVDLNLLAATLVSSHTRIWTLDKRLDALAGELDCGFQSPSSSRVH